MPSTGEAPDTIYSESTLTRLSRLSCFTASTEDPRTDGGRAELRAAARGSPIYCATRFVMVPLAVSRSVSWSTISTVAVELTGCVCPLLP